MIDVKQIVTLEQQQRARGEWQEIAFEYPGFYDDGDRYGGNAFGINFFLEAELGNWTGRVQLFGDGLYRGEWEKCDRRGRFVRMGGQPGPNIFVFEPQPTLSALLSRMEQWIEVRRDPATWHGLLADHNKAVLALAAENRRHLPCTP